jgi:hypothetical protein
MTDWADGPLTTASLADYVRENWPDFREMVARGVIDEGLGANIYLHRLIIRAGRAAAANAAERGDDRLAVRITNYYENNLRSFTVARLLAGLPRAGDKRIDASFELDIAALKRKRRAAAEAKLAARATRPPDRTDAPAGLLARPWFQGKPVPYTVLIREDGTPDFAVREPSVVQKVIEGRLCNLCGLPLGRAVAFLGDEEAVLDQDFGEPPAHIDCSEFALKACPFLSGARRVRANLEGRVQRWRRDDARPARWSPWSVVVTRDYRAIRFMGRIDRFHVRTVIRVITRQPDAPAEPAAARG